MLLAPGACAVDPLDEPCPDLQPGDIVITELQNNSPDEWIEVYVTKAVDLGGMTVRFEQLNGKNTRTFYIRESLPVESGYVVLGNYEVADPEVELPEYVAWNYHADISASMYSAASLQLRACGVLLDQVIYRQIPEEASRKYVGELTPEANDNEDAWCAGDENDGVGSPGEENGQCP